MAANAPGIALFTHLLDSVTTVNAGVDGVRRVRVTTPFGVITSVVGDAFTVSANPTVGASANATYAGGGYNGGTTTYSLAAGPLVINGTNFRGLTTIDFQTAAASVTIVTVDPAAPPAGYTFSADGKSITITAAALVATTGGWVTAGPTKTIILTPTHTAPSVTAATTQNFTMAP